MCKSFKKWPMNLWWISNKSIIEVGNVKIAATFKSFLHLSYKYTYLLFLWECYQKYFHETNINRWFLGITQNMNYTFPLLTFFEISQAIQSGKSNIFYSLGSLKPFFKNQSLLRMFSWKFSENVMKSFLWKSMTGNFWMFP